MVFENIDKLSLLEKTNIFVSFVALCKIGVKVFKTRDIKNFFNSSL